MSTFKVGDKVIITFSVRKELGKKGELIRVIDSIEPPLWAVKMEGASTENLSAFEEREFELCEIYESPLYKALE